MTNVGPADLRDALFRLRGSLESLRLAEGDSPYVRRLMNDLDRFQLDMEDVTGAGVRSSALHGSGRGREVVRISDGPYRPLAWQDSDDEGIGGHRR
ncbi:hypothetical protein GCM10010269_73350 [Streptomyces humidus]|uniref:Uncharacterized protein n=1 Tax=Streptomyces humidus TaxID=52259 RepID=A0A918L9I4_9ACTN|nr:hypothetical protein [Streptomyces humidus]GGS23840.1 hypothetical protein GCM10010269_73350 [Streptomyces humidus]